LPSFSFLRHAYVYLLLVDIFRVISFDRSLHFHYNIRHCFRLRHFSPTESYYATFRLRLTPLLRPAAISAFFSITPRHFTFFDFLLHFLRFQLSSSLRRRLFIR